MTYNGYFITKDKGRWRVTQKHQAYGIFDTMKEAKAWIDERSEYAILAGPRWGYASRCQDR